MLQLIFEILYIVLLTIFGFGNNNEEIYNYIKLNAPITNDY